MKQSVLLSVLWFLAACSGTSRSVAVPAPGVKHLDYTASELTAPQKRIVDAAESIIGKTRLSFGGTEFPYDCSGTILAVYYLAGQDLRPEFARQSGNGVLRLYRIAEKYKLISPAKNPLPGDVLFWDNTYDSNKDGKLNDDLTHAGIVVGTGPDGSIRYLHHHVRRGIVVETMNLEKPDIYQETRKSGLVILNAPMRIRESGARPEKWLAGQLYNSYGRLWSLSNAGTKGRG